VTHSARPLSYKDAFISCARPLCSFCDDNVCACAVSALTLLLVLNISPKMDFLYDVEILAVRRCFSPILAIVHCACTVSTILLFPV